MGCSCHRDIQTIEDIKPTNQTVLNQNENTLNNLTKINETKEKEKIEQELKEKDKLEQQQKGEMEEKERKEKEQKEKEEKERKEKEQKEKEEKERKEKEQKEKEEKEKQEKEQKEKEEKEKQEKEKKEQEEKKDVNPDEQTGEEEESHNKQIPSDPGHYLKIPLSTKKKGVFVPNKNDLERFQRDGLKRHNYYRKYHQSGPMELTKKLNDYAQSYAETLASKDVMQHSSDKQRDKIYGDWTGENLYSFWTSEKNLTINGAAAVDSWYDEINDYDFEKGKSKNGGVVGHFTQLVWKGSTQLGMGIARNSKNSVYVVANYHFGGNYNSAEKTNVFPAKA